MSTFTFQERLTTFKQIHLVSNADIAATFKVSERTVEGWMQGRTPHAATQRLLDLVESGEIPITVAR